MAKTYLATEETVSEIRDLITPYDLSSAEPFILDFVHDEIDIIHGALDTYGRTISN